MLRVFPDVRIQPFEEESGTIVPTPFQVVGEFFEPLNPLWNLWKSSCLHLVFEKLNLNLTGQTTLEAFNEVIEFLIGHMPDVTNSEDRILQFS